MNTDKIEKLLELMHRHGLNELELKEEEFEIKLSFGARNQTYAAMPPFMHAAPPVFSKSGIDNKSELKNSAQASVDSSSASKASGNYSEIRSPFVGTFYAAPSPGSDDFVYIGKRVKKGDTLCIVEAMKLMNEIEADRDGLISAILVENEQPIEYDQVLFHIEA